MKESTNKGQEETLYQALNQLRRKFDKKTMQMGLTLLGKEYKNSLADTVEEVPDAFCDDKVREAALAIEQLYTKYGVTGRKMDEILNPHGLTKEE